MRLLRFLVTIGALAVITLAAPRSQAQVEPMPKPEWSGRPSDSNTNLALISRADCLDPDAKITFNVAITGDVTSKNFEVWAGSDCATLTQRDEENSCMRLQEPAPAKNDNTVELSIRDLVQEIKTGAGKGVGTDESCRAETEKTSRTLFFLLVDSARAAASPGTWPFDFDLAAPDAPTNLKAGAGEQSLILDFDAPKGETEPGDYHYYCSEIGAETAVSNATGAAGAGSAADADCSSSVLVAGQAAPTEHGCGSTGATGVDSATTDMSLRNGVKYAVAVTFSDQVGNESVLSNVACGTPAEVTGFFEAYRKAGGQGGGGFCSFTPARRGALPLGLALLIAGAVFARRRR